MAAVSTDSAGGPPPLLLLHGGVLVGGRASAALWLYSMQLGVWRRVRPVGVVRAPPALSGHTLTAVTDRRLYVVGGRADDAHFTSDVHTVTLLLPRANSSAVSGGYQLLMWILKSKGSPYSITERRVPELIPVLGSQPAGDVSHKLGGRLSLLSARPAVTLAILKRAATSFAVW